MNVEELKKLLKENRIHFYTYWGKQKLIELAKINNLLPPKIDEPKKEVEEEKPKYVNYERLKNIRHTPIKVILEDVETKEKKTHTKKKKKKIHQFIKLHNFWINLHKQ